MLKPIDIRTVDYLTAIEYHKSVCRPHGISLSSAGKWALAKVIRNNLEELVYDSTLIVKKALEKAGNRSLK